MLADIYKNRDTGKKGEQTRGPSLPPWVFSDWRSGLL